MVCIRGAITIEENTKMDILNHTKTLLECVIKENNLNIEDIRAILFTATKDIDQAYPAVAARELGITQASLMCMQEMYVEGSLPLCIRLMLCAENGKSQDSAVHCYLKKAAALRPDLKR